MIRLRPRASLVSLVVLITGCRIESLPPASSRSDGGPVATRGTITHQARSEVRLYRDAAGCNSVQTVNRQFRLVRVQREEGPERLVLEESYDVRWCLEREGVSSEATVTAWRPDSAATPPLFRIVGRGVTGAPVGNLYRMVAYSCCGSQELATYFSLLTGRLLFSSSLPPRQLVLPARGIQRFAAFHDSYSAAQPPEVERDSSVVGVLQWGDDRTAAQRFVLRAEQPQPIAVTEIVFLARGEPATESLLTLTDQSGPVSLRVRWIVPGSTQSYTIDIPIDQAELAPRRARVPAGFRLDAAS